MCIRFRAYDSSVVSFFFFKQKTAYEMCISDWSSDVCSSDLLRRDRRHGGPQRWVLTAMLLHLPNGTLAHLGGKRVCLVHGSILSRVGASSNPGAVQPGDRAALVEGLIGSLDQPAPAMDSLWLKEAEDRTDA